MSTLAYARLTTARDIAPPSTSTSTSPPGVKTYVDALAALVPSEVLTLHALVLTVTTKITAGAAGTNAGSTTTISAPQTLVWAFVGLLLISVGLYVAPRLLDKRWDRLDWFRMAIPPLALLAWTMLQRSTAFDAVAPVMPDAARSVAALFLAVILGVGATALAYKADQKV